MSGLRGRTRKTGKQGPSGTYLFELEAQPGGPEGRSDTTAGSQPINVLEPPRNARPWILPVLCEVRDGNVWLAFRPVPGSLMRTEPSASRQPPHRRSEHTWYDDASNRTSLSATIGANDDFENLYSFDNLNRMTRIDQIGQTGGNTVANKRIDFTYDVASRITGLARQYKSGGSWLEAATTAFSYDTIDRLTGIDHKRGGTSLFTAYAYTFDSANRITGNTSQDGTAAFTYDVTNQLTGVDYSYQTDEAFSFDANGNWNMSGYSVGTNNRMTSDGTYNYTHDKEGNVILRVKISDGSRTEYTWDHRNRLINITTRAMQYGAATSSVDYVYDTFDRRISKSHDANGAGGGKYEAGFVDVLPKTKEMLEK